MINLPAAAGFVLSVTLMFAGAPRSEQEQRPKAAKSGKRETLGAEQKQQLKESLKRAFEQRNSERPRLLARLKATEDQRRTLERQRINTENRALRARVGAFTATTEAARVDAIEREARALWRRAAKATDAERGAIDRRAAALLAELRGRNQRR